MGVAVTPKNKDWSTRAIRLLGGGEPNLAGAALHLVRVDICRCRKRSKRPAKLDDLAIAIFPFIEQREIVADLVDRHEATIRLIAVARIRKYR
jgi:hypothetical protein